MPWVQLTCLVLGVLGLLGLVLVQPDEERRFRNVLVDWWVSVTFTGENWTETHAAFSRAYAKKALAAFQFVFGPRFGWRFVLGSLLFTQLAILSGFTAVVAVHPHLLHADIAKAVSVIAAQFLLLLFAMFRWPTLALLAFGLSWLVLLAVMMTTQPILALNFPVAMALGILADILVVSANRRVLRRTVDSRSHASIVLLGAVIVLPLGLSRFLLHLAAHYQVTGTAILTVAACINVVFSCVSIIMVLLFLISVATWSGLSRVLATMHERGPSRSHVLTVSVLLICIGLARQPLELLLDKAGLGGGKSVIAQPATPETETLAATAAGAPAK